MPPAVAAPFQNIYGNIAVMMLAKWIFAIGRTEAFCGSFAVVMLRMKRKRFWRSRGVFIRSCRRRCGKSFRPSFLHSAFLKMGRAIRMIQHDAIRVSWISWGCAPSIRRNEEGFAIRYWRIFMRSRMLYPSIGIKVRTGVRDFPPRRRGRLWRPRFGTGI